jgi:hypothetical protein
VLAEGITDQAELMDAQAYEAFVESEG